MSKRPTRATAQNKNKLKKETECLISTTNQKNPNDVIHKGNFSAPETSVQKSFKNTKQLKRTERSLAVCRVAHRTTAGPTFKIHG